MAKKFSTAHLSWADRCSLIDHYKPTDDDIMSVFKLTADELATARQLRNSGTFAASKTLDVCSYDGIFGSKLVVSHSQTQPHVSSTPLTTKSVATSHAMPESATKRTKQPQKRGRRGDKIAHALLSAPVAPVPVEVFMKQYGVSLAVLRQSKRFIEKLDEDARARVGKIVVKQDKATKQLMIWKQS